MGLWQAAGDEEHAKLQTMDWSDLSLLPPPEIQEVRDGAAKFPWSLRGSAIYLGVWRSSSL